MFRSLFRRAIQSPTHQIDGARRRPRLGLECLESREVPAFLTVTSNSDTPVANLLTLRQALDQVMTLADETNFIDFALPAGQNVITLQTPLEAITRNLSINGTIIVPGVDGEFPSSDKVTIQRDPEAAKFRLFGVGPDVRASFSNLKLLHGDADGADGGAIFGVSRTLGGYA